jgi:hypothetical protein
MTQCTTAAFSAVRQSLQHQVNPSMSEQQRQSWIRLHNLQTLGLETPLHAVQQAGTIMTD